MKPRILYYVHAHGAGHMTTFRLLYPELEKYFQIIAVTTNELATKAVRSAFDISVIELPPKWAAGSAAPKHTFSKAFEETPYTIHPAERVAALTKVVLQYKPAAFVCDGSPELAITARSMGVPVVLVHLLGDTMCDPTQIFTYELADHIVAHFPAQLQTPGYAYTAKTSYYGFISRYAGQDPIGHGSDDTTIITVLLGHDNYSPELMRRITADGSRRFVIIGNHSSYDLGSNCRQLGRVRDVAAVITGNIVVTAAGQNSIAELISLNKTLVLLPEPRPYDEQYYNARTLADNHAALLASNEFEAVDWARILDRAADFIPHYEGLVNPDGPRKIAAQLKEWYA